MGLRKTAGHQPRDDAPRPERPRRTAHSRTWFRERLNQELQEAQLGGRALRTLHIIYWAPTVLSDVPMTTAMNAMYASLRRDRSGRDVRAGCESAVSPWLASCIWRTDGAAGHLQRRQTSAPRRARFDRRRTAACLPLVRWSIREPDGSSPPSICGSFGHADAAYLHARDFAG